MAFSGDGKWLASASSARSNSLVKVWDTASGLETRTLKGLTTVVTTVMFSADGKRLVSADNNDTMKMWDPTSGQEILTRKGICRIAISADGTRLASVSVDPDVRVWDAKNGALLHTLKGHKAGGWSVALSADGKRVASASGGVKIWDVGNSKEPLTLKGHTGSVRAVALTLDGKRLASGGDDRTVKVWDATNGNLLDSLNGHTAKVTSVAFSEDGKLLASASDDKTVKLWGTVEDKGTANGAASGATKANSGTAVTKPVASPTVVTPTAAPLPPAKHVRTLAAGYCMDARVTPDEKFVATLDLDGQVKLWKMDTGELIRTVGKHGERADHLALFADGQLVVAGGYSQGVKFWDVSKSADPLASLPVTGSQGINVEGTADGRHLIVRVAGAVRLYRLTVTPPAAGSKKAIAKTGLPKNVAAQTLVARAMASFGELEIHSLGEMPSSRVMAASPTNPNWIYFCLKSDPTKLCLWDIAKDREVCRFAGLTKDAFWIGLSPDGRRLVSVGGDVPIAHIWDAATGKLSQRIPLTSLPAQVVLLPDGHRALSHPFDAPIEEWDLDTPRKLRTIPVQRNRVHKVYGLANGTRIVVASAAGAEIWDLPAPAK